MQGWMERIGWVDVYRNDKKINPEYFAQPKHCCADQMARKAGKNRVCQGKVKQQHTIPL